MTMPLLRSVVLCSLLLAAGCPGDVPPRDSIDGGADIPDAPLGTPDAPLGTPDAPVTTPDARPPDASTVDAATACTYMGQQGTCLATAVCSSLGMVSVPSSMGANGCQPFPVDIQCCVAHTASPLPQPNEGLSEEPGADGCPEGMLRIYTSTDSYCIDRFEASLEAPGGEPWSPYYNPGSTAVVARSLRGAVPQGYITGEQAKAACARAGKRLCTDTEWLRACRGPSSTTYPYGSTRMNGVCNDARAKHPAVELFGSVTNLTSPLINQLVPGLDRTGARTGCVTAEGAMDMMGNLHEWTADPAGTFRGGFYVDTRINGEGCLYVTTAHNTLHYDYSTGFRCCAD